RPAQVQCRLLTRRTHRRPAGRPPCNRRISGLQIARGIDESARRRRAAGEAGPRVTRSRAERKLSLRVKLPNALTLSRLAAIPVLMVLLIVRFPWHDQIAAALFIVFSLTDTLDGQIARRRGIVSDLGKFLDPLADKLFVLSVLIVLVQEGLVAAWVVVVIFSRELLITLLRSVGASQGRVIAAAPLGKTKTVTQMAAVALLILQRPYPVLVPVAGFAV